MPPPFQLRPASAADIPALQGLIEQSGIGLAKGFYTPQQAQALTREVFGVDTQLIEDGSYFVIAHGARILACGGWSRRSTPYGGDRLKLAPERLLDPATEAAKIRAFFVHPEMARRGLGALLLQHCSEQARAAGFRALELTATMPGVPLYTAHGFAPVQTLSLSLAGGAVTVPLALMRKTIGADPGDASQAAPGA